MVGLGAAPGEGSRLTPLAKRVGVGALDSRRFESLFKLLDLDKGDAAKRAELPEARTPASALLSPVLEDDGEEAGKCGDVPCIKDLRLSSLRCCSSSFCCLRRCATAETSRVGLTESLVEMVPIRSKVDSSFESLYSS